MKSINIYLVLLLFLTLGFHACKKDLGNYTYNDVNVPVTDMAGVAALYNIEQFNSLTVTPTVNYVGDTTNLSYQWLVYPKSLSSITGTTTTLLSDKRKLNVNLSIPPGNYYLELLITDKSNGIKTTSRTLLNVLAAIETGWLVLHSLNNESEVDFIASKNLSPTGPEKRIKNLFQSVIGSKMKGEGQMIGFSRRSNSGFNWITVGTDQGIKRMNGFTFALLASDNELFRRPLTVKNFQAHIHNGSSELVINNGQLHGLPWAVVQDALYNSAFVGDYNIAPYIVFNDFSPYGALVYDQKAGKFMYTGQNLANVDYTQFKDAAAAAPAIPGVPATGTSPAIPPVAAIPFQVFSPNNIGKELLFMDRGFNKNAYAFFKDRTGNGRWLYILDQNTVDAGATTGTLALGKFDLTAMPGITDAKFFQVGDVGNVALYATEKIVYRYDYLGNQTSSIVFNGIPSNEVITCMKIFKPITSYVVPAAEFTLTNNAVVYVATWNGTEGKLYELSMNIISGQIDPTPLKVYEGFGKIKDMTSKFRGTGT